MPESPVVIREVDNVLVVSFRDPSMLDSLTVEAVGADLESLLQQYPQRAFVLDFANVHFLSSPALSMLLTLRRKADQAGAQIVLCELRPDIARLFHITKLDKLFLFDPTVAEALTRLASRPQDQSSPSTKPM